jgi:hypothetical protein
MVLGKYALKDNGRNRIIPDTTGQFILIPRIVMKVMITQQQNNFFRVLLLEGNDGFEVF